MCCQDFSICSKTFPYWFQGSFLTNLKVVFLWRGKVPRIKIKTLHNNPQHGGLKLPKFELLYWAAQIRAIWFWQTELNNPPAWKQIEQFHVADVLLAGIPFIQAYHTLKNSIVNPLINHTSKLWSIIQSRLKSVKPLHRNTPFHNNPALPTALRDSITKIWHNLGIKTCGDF